MNIFRSHSYLPPIKFITRSIYLYNVESESQRVPNPFFTTFSTEYSYDIDLRLLDRRV